MEWPKIFEHAGASSSLTGVLTGALSRVLGSLIGVGFISSVGYLFTPLSDPPEMKLERAIFNEIVKLTPENKRHQNFIVGAFQYQDNFTFRCRATNTFVYPVGVSPKSGHCVGTYEPPNDEILREHQTGRCVSLGVYNVKSDSSTATIWRTNGLIAESSCPIFVDGELWGYLGILYQENLSWKAVDGEELLVPTYRASEKREFTERFRDPVQEVIQASGKSHLVLGVHGNY